MLIALPLIVFAACVVCFLLGSVLTYRLMRGLPPVSLPRRATMVEPKVSAPMAARPKLVV